MSELQQYCIIGFEPAINNKAPLDFTQERPYYRTW